MFPVLTMRDSKPHLLGYCATIRPAPAGLRIVLPAPVAAPAPRKRRQSAIRPAPSDSGSDGFWRALADAKARYHRSHDVPLPWAATPAKARKRRFLNHRGELATVKQPAQFPCPPARFWAGGVIPLGVVAPVADLDVADAEYAARCERHHAANLANLRRWAQYCFPDQPEFADPAGVALADARATCRGAPARATDHRAVIERMRAECALSAWALWQARKAPALPIAA